MFRSYRNTPGSGIWLNFNVGDQIINELVYVQAVTHNFNNNKHVMDLDVIYFDKQNQTLQLLIMATKKLEREFKL